MKYITLQQLRDANACKLHVDRFRRRFGERFAISKKNVSVAQKKSLYVTWAVVALLTRTQQNKYWVLRRKLRKAALADWSEAKHGSAAEARAGKGSMKYPTSRSTTCTTERNHRMPRKRRRDNIGFVSDLMNYSDYGALAQLFVLDALDKWSKLIASKDAKELDTPLVSGAAWKGVAEELQKKIAERLV